MEFLRGVPVVLEAAQAARKQDDKFAWRIFSGIAGSLRYAIPHPDVLNRSSILSCYYHN